MDAAGAAWAAADPSQHAAAAGAADQVPDAALSHLLQQQHAQQHAVLTDEQLAAVGAGGQAARGVGSNAAAARTDITLPPVPDLQGTSLAHLDQAGAGQEQQQQQHMAGGAAAQAHGTLSGQQQQQQAQLAALAGGLLGEAQQQLCGVKREAGDAGEVPGGDTSSMTDLLLAMAANQQDGAALRQLLALQQAAGLNHPAGTEPSPAAAAAATGQHLGPAGSTASSSVLAAPLALSLGAAGDLPLLQANLAGLQQTPLPVSSLSMPDSNSDAAAAAAGSGGDHAAAAGGGGGGGGTVTSFQALQMLQLVQLPNGQLQALQQQQDLSALLQQQQQQLALLAAAGVSSSSAAAEAGGYGLGDLHHNHHHNHQSQQQQQSQGPVAKRRRLHGVAAAAGGTEDEAAELAGLQAAAEHAAEAAMAAATAAAATDADGDAAATAEAAAAAGVDPGALALLQQLAGGAELQQAHLDAAAALGTFVNVGGINMLLPAPSQLQLAALTGSRAVAAAAGASDAQGQEQQLLTLQQQLQLAQLPLMTGGLGVTAAAAAGGGAAAAEGDPAAGALPGAASDISQLQLQQIQQLQQVQLLQLQLAAQQGLVVPPGMRLGLGGLEFDDDESVEGHMVRRHGVLPERMVSRDMLRQVFHLPIEDAAKQLGIGQTMLKHYCRKFGIPRWPFRKRQSVVQLIQSIENYAQGNDRPQVVEPALQKLRSFLVQIDEDPNVDLDGPIKRLRQAFFKEAYKARVRKQQDGGDEGRSYGGRGGRGGQRPDGWLENLCQAIVDAEPETTTTTTTAQHAVQFAALQGMQGYEGLGAAAAAGASLQHTGYHTDAEMVAAAAAAAAGGGGSVGDLAAVAALQQQLAAAAAAGGAAGLMDPQVLAASVAAAAQLQGFQQQQQQQAAVGDGLQGYEMAHADGQGGVGLEGLVRQQQLALQAAATAAAAVDDGGGKAE